MNDDDESLFELYLHDLDSAPPSSDMTPAALSHQEPAPLARDLRDDLRLARALRHLHAPTDETRGARARVLLMLREEMAASSHQDGAGTHVMAALPLPIARRRRKPRRLARIALVAAAILLLACMASWQISTAAASALPGSPLYGVKRGEEQLALDTAWSDQRRGEVLALIADHRLAEMRAEAALHHDALVQSLARELDSTMRQLISLTATMAARHEDTTVVAASLAHEMDAEYLALNTARRNGDVTLAQVLSMTVQSEHTAIQNSHITLPPSAVTTPAPGPGAPPTTRPNPGPMPTHTPPAGPGNSNGNGNNHGNSNSNGHNSNSGSQNSGNAEVDDDQDQSSNSALVGCADAWFCAPTQWETGFTHCYCLMYLMRHPSLRQLVWDRTHRPWKA